MAIAEFFKRVLFSTRERPSSSDWNKLQERIYESLRMDASMTFKHSSTFGTYIARHSLAGAQGFHAGGFYLQVDSAVPPLGIKLGSGVGFGIFGPTGAESIDSDVGADWDGAGGFSAPLVLSADQALPAITIPAAGSSRIDIIEVRPQYTAADAATVGIFNAITEVFDATTRNKSLTWDLYGLTGTVNSPAVSTAAISVKRGVEAVGALTAATEPTATSGYVKVGRVNLDNSGGALAAVTQDLLVDYRPLLFAQNSFTMGADFDLPGIAAGVATGLLRHVQSPPGVVLFAGFDPSVPPAAGTSYHLTCYLIGGDLTSGTLSVQRGNVATSTYGTGAVPRIPETWAQPMSGAITAAVRAELAASGATWTNLGPLATIAVGQPYVSFGLNLRSATGAALSNTERISFLYSQGANF